MAQRIVIPNILNLNDEYFKNIKLSDKTVTKKATFINLIKPLDLILPVKFCYGARLFSASTKVTEPVGKPSLTYDIYTLEDARCLNLEHDRIVFKNINKIAEALKKEFESSTSPDIVNIRNKILRKHKEIVIVGCKEVIPPDEKQATAGKYAIYIPIEIQSPDEMAPKKFVTQITDLNHKNLNPSEIINVNNTLNTGLYNLMISITGVTIVNNDKITMTILCKKCTFERKKNANQEAIDEAWKEEIDKRKKLNSKSSDENEENNEEVVDEFANIEDGEISIDDLKEYADQINSLSIKN